MTLVEAEQAVGTVALREDHYRAVGEAESEIGAPSVEGGDGRVVAGLQARDLVALSDEVTEEGAPGRFAEADAEQVEVAGEGEVPIALRSRLVCEIASRTISARGRPSARASRASRSACSPSR